MSIAQRIRQLREERDLLQKELADQIKVSVETVKSWEQGRAVPDSPNRQQLVKIFAIAEADLFSSATHQDFAFLSQLGFAPDDLTGFTSEQLYAMRAALLSLMTTFREQNKKSGVTPDEKKAATIFIIDDEIKLTHLLAKTFSLRGYETAYAFDGRSAMTQILAGTVKPAVILLDLKMPKMDGLRFLRQLRTLNHGAKIVVISASDETAMTELMAHHKIDGFLAKPFQLEEVVQMVKRLVGA